MNNKRKFMKPIAWMIMAACLALTACGGDDVAMNGGASLSTPATPGTPSNPSPPTGGGPGGGGSQATAGWSNAAAMDGKAPEFEPSVTIDASGNALVSWMTSGTGNGNAAVDILVTGIAGHSQAPLHACPSMSHCRITTESI
ncbi:hypothetical protein [Burkholderia stagnalis]|uniref:hypothetical protein n=1 Tax=Burkholderia stagnalis TaxID=1503054 RepID=UPI000751FED0|nr:hypothetical protein [Burkholderia stagnalis]KVC58977.1 hypothetical protein WS59_20900 [Burkholderia stagnalis]KVN21825.1 hypothetical protein WT10_10745 [Burkholderia stagnalis]KWI65304.1 hypothetical protein WT75_28060 [Burkholderia stagnalis]KWK62999.1 hypothetical protein WT82_02155 [Burkholderia stagnalis]KWN24899.1 hypothetical protein WT84_05995 [Burkholderia stagnalis]